MSIWNVLRNKANSEQVANVEWLVEHASSLLDLVRDTFPTYTLHNHTHAENVLRNMEALVGRHIHDLSALESAMLILSAYYHDIGMVARPDERSTLPADPDFGDFLSKDPRAFLTVASNDGKVAPEIHEQYCRDRHGDRVFIFLSDLPENRIRWRNVSLRTKLGTLCRSHTRPAAELRDDAFDEFLGDCDLRFCAILLRLADILDFDNSRSPDAVYEYLGLSERRTARETISDIEWRKHLCADRFIFPDERSPGYTLNFVAGPDDPAVEHDVRQFLDIIESELTSCQSLLPHTANRWRDLALPSTIDRRNIVSNGYHYGDFRFKLDREAVLELFMGERLYDDPWVFVRELLQNSIDATRARAFLNGLQSADPSLEIKLHEWDDNAGNRWIRIDDNGLGMNLSIVEDYLLRIGQSYYSSNEFAADLVRAKGPDTHIVSIGRFGIGLLSVFMLGSRVELSTRRVTTKGELEGPIRMTFPNLQGYFTLQIPPDSATKMPGWRAGEDLGYRSAGGTSIAVKIDSRRSYDSVGLYNRCRSYLYATPVRVSVNGIDVEDGSAATEKDWESGGECNIDWQRTRDLEPSFLRALSMLHSRIERLDFSSVNLRSDVSGSGVLLLIDTHAFTRYIRSHLAETIPTVNYFRQNWDRSSSHRYGDQASHERLVHRIQWDAIGDDVLEQFRAAVTPTVSFSDHSMHGLVHIRLNLFSDWRLARLGEFSRDNGDLNKEEVWLLNHLRDLKSSFEPMREFEGTVRVAPSEALSSGRLLNSREWSHNGIRLPLLADRPWQSFSNADNMDKSASGAIFGSISLEDSLRPDLDIARSKVVHVSPEVESAIILTTRRAAEKVYGRRDIRWRVSPTFERSRIEPGSKGRETLGEYISDPLITHEDGWINEPLFTAAKDDDVIWQVNDDLMSVKDIFEECTFSRPIFLRLPDRGRSSRTDMTFLNRLAWALLRFHLKCRLEATRRSGFVIRVDGRLLNGDSLSKGLLFFSPDFFIPYSDTEPLFVLPTGDVATPINESHPLIEWYLESVDVLEEVAPVLNGSFAKQLMRLKEGPHFSKVSSAIKTLNEMVPSLSIAMEQNGFAPYRGAMSQLPADLLRLGL